MSNEEDFSNLKIALVHDELTRRGGAEVVLAQLLRIVPHADVYTLYAGRPQITVDGVTHVVRTTFLQRFPRWWRRHPGRLLPLLSYAAESIDLAAYDLVISSASAFAKAIVTRATIPHICYCHTPTRYLWDTSHEILGRTPRWQRGPAKVLLHLARIADFVGAQRVDHYIANSKWTQQRIATYYRAESTVIYPPIDTSFFTPRALGTGEHKQFFLCVGRLTPSKHFEQAIAVCAKLSLPLIVVGEGQELRRLRRLAGKHTQVVGKVDQETLRSYYRQARALLQPGTEDFGMATAEALACGTPVIAYGVGGAAEIIRHNETGLLYTPASVEGLAEAVRLFLSRQQPFIPGELQNSVLKFSTSAFDRAIRQQVKHVIANQI